MRVLVCGGRSYGKRLTMYAELDKLLADIEVLIHGAAPGADTVADQWAESRGVPRQPFPAKWKELGKRAGPVRNAQMLADGKPDVVIAFPGGDGTDDMVKKARAAGVRVIFGDQPALGSNRP